MPQSRRPRCATEGCGSECLTPATAAPVVVFAATLALFVPFLDSMGVKLNSSLTEGLQLTYLAIFVLVAWAASIALGCLRRHEDGLVCFFDSLGRPGLITAGIYGVKIFSGNG
jgi:hypothetical protein